MQCAAATAVCCGADVSFGSFGLKAVGRGRLTARQIEAARRAGRPVQLSQRQGKI